MILFYYYKHDLERLKKFLEGRDYRVLKSEKDIEDWNRGEIPVMLLNPASAGHGLNLQFVNIYPYITAQTAILYYEIIGVY
jgi:SNF2 family DNA or RNA helicase